MKTVMMLLSVLMLSACGMEQVSEGYRGIYTNWGKVVGEPLTPGLHFYNPISSSIFEIDVRERSLQGTTECFTSDNQKVDTTFTVTFFPEQSRIGYLYSQFGMQWEATVVQQVVLGSLKDVFGKFKADDVVSNRDSVRSMAEASMRSALAERAVTITRIDLTNIQFSKEYEQAVERKVVAIQAAAEAKNKTVQVQEEAQQVTLAARAHAEAMRIKSQALSQNQNLVQYEAVQRWNGVLPVYQFGNTIPLLNLNSLTK